MRVTGREKQDKVWLAKSSKTESNSPSAKKMVSTGKGSSMGSTGRTLGEMGVPFVNEKYIQEQGWEGWKLENQFGPRD